MTNLSHAPDRVRVRDRKPVVGVDITEGASTPVQPPIHDNHVQRVFNWILMTSCHRLRLDQSAEARALALVHKDDRWAFSPLQHAQIWTTCG